MRFAIMYRYYLLAYFLSMSSLLTYASATYEHEFMEKTPEITEQLQKDLKEYTGQKEEALLAELDDFSTAIEKLTKHIIGSSNLGSLAKAALLQHLNNMAIRMLNDDNDAQAYFIGLYRAISLCKKQQDLIIKRLQHEVLTSTKIMTALFALASMPTVIKFKYFSLPGLQKPSFDYFKKPLMNEIYVFNDHIKKKVVLLPTTCALEKTSNTNDTTTALELVKLLAHTVQANAVPYAMLAFAQLLADAYYEQFILESDILFQRTLPAKTPAKDFLNTIVQWMSISDSDMGYRYFATNIGWLSRYTFKSQDDALKIMNNTLLSFQANQKELFTSVFNKITLSLVNKANSNAQQAKVTFNYLQKLFEDIINDKTLNYKDDILQHLTSSIISTTHSNNLTTLIGLSKLTLNTLQEEVSNEFGPTRYTFKRWFGIQTQWQATWIDVMQAWITATLEQLKQQSQAP